MKKQSSKKKVKRIPVPGYPGLFTFENFERDPKREKKVVDKIMRDAERMGREEDRRIERILRSLRKTIQGVG